MAERREDGENDASLSFIEPLATARAEADTRPEERAAPPALQVPPDIIDPVFLNYSVGIPSKIEKFFKDTAEIKFIYKFDSADHMSVEDTLCGAPPYLVHVDFFEEFGFPEDMGPRLVFILGRQRCRTAQKAAQRRAYRAAIERGVAYEGVDAYRALRMRYLEYQVNTGCNFVFIDDTEALHRQIRNVVRVLGRKERYIPRVKTFEEATKAGFVQSVLKSIPGVSENVARCIHERYPTFRALREALISNREALVNLVVCDSTGQNARPLGERVLARLSVSFLSAERNRRI